MRLVVCGGKLEVKMLAWCKFRKPGFGEPGLS
jgi:hypothetical protein